MKVITGTVITRPVKYGIFRMRSIFRVGVGSPNYKIVSEDGSTVFSWFGESKRTIIEAYLKHMHEHI